MTLDTYANLKAEIADHLDRDDLTEQIGTFIRLAETRHAQDIRIRQMLRRVQTTLTDRFLALPSNFLSMKVLRLLTSPVLTLEELSVHELTRLRREGEGVPEYYTVHQDIEFDRSPRADLTVEMIHYAQPDALSDLNPSNEILARVPDAYLYGSLIAAAPFLVDDERLTVWTQLYTAAKDAVNAMDRRRAGPLVSRVSGATP